MNRKVSHLSHWARNEALALGYFIRTCSERKERKKRMNKKKKKRRDKLGKIRSIKGVGVGVIRRDSSCLEVKETVRGRGERKM